MVRLRSCLFGILAIVSGPYVGSATLVDEGELAAAEGETGARQNLAGQGQGQGQRRRLSVSVTDAGGDTCSWYGSRPHLCGCCDDEDFSALACPECACEVFSVGCSTIGDNLSEELLHFPNKTTRISFAGFDFKGVLPGNLPERFPLLKVLDLSRNQLQGRIPSSLWQLPQLRVLNLAGNMFEGPLSPSVGSATGLQEVFLHDNELSGVIPAEVGAWRQIKTVHLHRSGLRGSIPCSVGNWTQVREVWLSENLLSREIPAEVGAWQQLRAVSLHSNKFSGSLPRSVGRWRQVREVHLNDTGLSGSLPEEVGAWQQVEIVHLGMNSLSGPIPSSVANWTLVRLVDLQDNSLDGPIPPAVGGWSQVRDVRLHKNNLSGRIPAEVGAWQQLEYVHLGLNQLSGRIPPAVGNWTQVQSVHLHTLALSGPLPPAAGNWRQVRFVHLHSNRLSGRIPKIVRNWTQAVVVYLRQNRLSGPIPPEVGAWQLLERVDLSSNRLSGAIPAVVGNWRRVSYVSMKDNFLSGPLPESVGSWHAVVEVSLENNQLSGLVPGEALQQWRDVAYIRLSRNQLRGRFPNTQGLQSLNKLLLNVNSFDSVGALPLMLQELDIGHNNFTALPEALYGLGNLRTLKIQGNQISSWPPRGVFPRRAGRTPCGSRPLEPRFEWSQLRKLEASGNPLGRTGTGPAEVRDQLRVFMTSLAYLQELIVLRCIGCGFIGKLPRPVTTGNLADDVPHFGNADCTGVPRILPGFIRLAELNLAKNNIVSVEATPSRSLLTVDFSGNNLTHLDNSWFNEKALGGIVQLRLLANPMLAVPILPPSVVATGCNSSGETSLIADPLAFKAVIGESGEPTGEECTSLCPGRRTRYHVDRTINVSALCRCAVGFGGSGGSCTRCPANSYSLSDGGKGDTHGMVRTCLSCPKLSHPRDGASSLKHCICPKGYFLDFSKGVKASCSRCRQWPHRTTPREGLLSDSACVCNTNYSGLRDVGGVCGCEEGTYMNHFSRECVKCSFAENCAWGVDLQSSLEPPKVRRGFWREPPPSDLSQFAQNSVWRCFTENCNEDGRCPEGRHGRACSLCMPGRFGGSEGPCRSCPHAPAAQACILVAAALAITPFVVALHCLLMANTEELQTLLVVKALRGSMRQMVKHLLTLSVIGGFSVTWPPLAKAFFVTLASFTVRLPSFASFACLQQQTSASLEVGAKLAIPLVFILVALLAMPLSWLLQGAARRCGRLLKRPRLASADMAMGCWDVVRILLFTGVLVYSSLLSITLEILTCIPSPNGRLTVVTYPHVVCGPNPEFLTLALISIAAFASYIGGLSAAVFLGLRHCRACYRVERERGWYSFLFEDFRDAHMSWTLYIMAKDAAYVAVPALLWGQGAAQLLTTSALSGIHAVRTMQNRPFQESSNTLLEVWNSASLAAVCIYSAGMGFQSTVGIAEISQLFEDGEDSSIYRGRDIGMLVVLTLAVSVPASILLYQLLCAFPRVVRLMPKCIRPVTPEETDEWAVRSLNSMMAFDIESFIKRADRISKRQLCEVVKQIESSAGSRWSEGSPFGERSTTTSVPDADDFVDRPSYSL